MCPDKTPESFRKKKAGSSAFDYRPYQLMQMVDELRRQNAELSHANEELRSFAHSVAHDLRTPLRGIDGFSKVLFEECAPLIGEDGRKYLGMIRDSVQRANKIVESLMRLSQISRSAIHFEEVELADIVRASFERHQAEDPARQATLRIEGEGIRVSCDREFMQIALENLVNNAWKFSGKRESTEIVFASKRTLHPKTGEQEVAFALSDNGSGFSMDEVEKLFSPFQRLHSESEFQGFGVGLATVKRVIRKHGGRVWAHSDEGKGATFGFALPL